jgi:hypothetical protein
MTDIYKEMNKVETDLSRVRSALVTRQLTNEEEASYLNQLDEILEKRNIHKNIHYKHDIKQSKVHNEFANQSEIYHDTGSKVKEKKEVVTMPSNSLSPEAKAFNKMIDAIRIKELLQILKMQAVTYLMITLNAAGPFISGFLTFIII